MPADNDLLIAALAYADLGWAVVPLHTVVNGVCSCRQAGCGSPGKHPRTKNGLSDATTDGVTITRWWSTWRAANIGVNCGESGLFAVDIDPKHGGDDSWIEFQKAHPAAWQDTVISLTGGGGQHYLYTQPKDRTLGNSSKELGFGPGIDVRGKGGYIVVPPSVHASGRRYEWENAPEEVEVAVYPGPLPTKKLARNVTRLNGERISDGDRNTMLISLAGTMRQRGMSEAAIVAALLEENQTRCDPPLSDEEVTKTAISGASYPPGANHAVKQINGFKGLRKILTDPPQYLLAVDGHDVRVGGNTLASYRLLKTAVIEQADAVPPAMQGYEWDAILAGLLKELQVIAAPDDASESGLIWTAVCEHLATRKDVEERYAQGNPIEHKAMAITNGAMVRTALKTRGITVDQREIWKVCEQHNAAKKNVYLAGKQEWVWAIPLEELDVRPSE